MAAMHANIPQSSWPGRAASSRVAGRHQKAGDSGPPLSPVQESGVVEAHRKRQRAIDLQKRVCDDSYVTPVGAEPTCLAVREHQGLRSGAWVDAVACVWTSRGRGCLQCGQAASNAPRPPAALAPRTCRRACLRSRPHSRSPLFCVHAQHPFLKLEFTRTHMRHWQSGGSALTDRGQ